MAPLLSVVVPFYGVERYIGACLESLARQTYTDLEVICVDDGSLDGSAAIAEAMCQADSRFRIVRQANAGLGPARNTGIDHARGEYLTFVDSDDLVPRPAYEQMIHSLERSGSSIAVGNARRFNNTGGVRQSWTHRVVAPQNVTATHVDERPALALDRMVWNKIYRADFFAEFGYRFPAIRYEDYPVTLPAHIDAVSVDILRTPCYFWRERESGDSITQQVFNYDNLYDRVVSAEMVFEHLPRLRVPARNLVQSYMADVDLQAMVQAFQTVPDDEVGPLLDLGRRFANTLDPAVIAGRPKFDQIQYRALVGGDVELLRQTAQFRADGGLIGGVRASRARRGVFEAAYPGHSNPQIPRELFRLSDSDLAVWTSVRSITWSGNDLYLEGTAEIRHVLTTADSDVSVQAVDAEGYRYPLEVTRFATQDSHGQQAMVGIGVTVPESLLMSIPSDGWPLSFRVSVRVGQVERVYWWMSLMGGSPLWPDGHWSPSRDFWWQPGPGKGGRLSISRAEDPVRVTGVVAEGENLILTGLLPGKVTGPVSVRIPKGRQGANLTVPAQLSPHGLRTQFTATIAGSQVVADDPADDPFTLGSHRTVFILMPGHTARSLIWAGPQDEGDETSPAARVRADERLVSLVPSPSHWLMAQHGPGWGTVTAAVARGRYVDVHLVGLDPQTQFVWRRFDAVTDEAVDVMCQVTEMTQDESGIISWIATIDSADLVAPDLGARIPGRPRADWTFFSLTTEHAGAASLDPSASRRLPQAVQPPARLLALFPQDRVGLTAHRGSLHIEVG